MRRDLWRSFRRLHPLIGGPGALVRWSDETPRFIGLGQCSSSGLTTEKSFSLPCIVCCFTQCNNVTSRIFCFCSSYGGPSWFSICYFNFDSA